MKICNLYNLAIFGQILMKFSPKIIKNTCICKKLGIPYMLFTMHLGKFLLIFKLIGKGHTVLP